MSRVVAEICNRLQSLVVGLVIARNMKENSGNTESVSENTKRMESNKGFYVLETLKDNLCFALPRSSVFSF